MQGSHKLVTTLAAGRTYNYKLRSPAILDYCILNVQWIWLSIWDLYLVRLLNINFPPHRIAFTCRSGGMWIYFCENTKPSSRQRRHKLRFYYYHSSFDIVIFLHFGLPRFFFLVNFWLNERRLNGKCKLKVAVPIWAARTTTTNEPKAVIRDIYNFWHLFGAPLRWWWWAGGLGRYYDNNLNFSSRRHSDDRQKPRHRQSVFVSPVLPFADAEFK